MMENCVAVWRLECVPQEGDGGGAGDLQDFGGSRDVVRFKPAVPSVSTPSLSSFHTQMRHHACDVASDQIRLRVSRRVRRGASCAVGAFAQHLCAHNTQSTCERDTSL